MLSHVFADADEFNIAVATLPIGSGRPSRSRAREHVGLNEASPARAREFNSGRDAAREALEHLGAYDCKILRADDRIPVWPEGIVGSISHSADTAIAVASRDRRIAGIGVDVEQASAPAHHNIARHILTPCEAAEMADSSHLSEGEYLATVVCCKEAAYKAVYPMMREYFDFLDIKVELDHASNRFRITAVADLKSSALLSSGSGLIRRQGGQFLALFTIPASSINRSGAGNA